MNPAMLAAGIALVLVALMDALWTTLWVEGHAGPLAGRLARITSALLAKLLGRLGHRALSVKGPILLVLSVVLWTGLLWAGWCITFAAEPAGLVHARSGLTADASDRAYFVGYTLATLGNGDFTPVGAGWQMATALASLSGMGLVTLLVTYLLSIVEAVVGKRSFASHVYAIGASGEDFVTGAWDGRGFRLLDLQLLSLVEQLNKLTEQHQAYPLLHYFHSREDRQASSYAVAVLGEAAMLLGHVVHPDVRPAPSSMRAVDAAVQGFVEALRGAHADPADEDPRAPAIERLREVGIPLDPSPGLMRALEERADGRRLLFALTRMERRGWPEPAG